MRPRRSYLVEVSEAVDVGHGDRLVDGPERIDLLHQPLLHALVAREQPHDERESGGCRLRPRQQELKRHPAHVVRLQQLARCHGVVPGVQQERQRVHPQLPPFLHLPPLHDVVQPLHQPRVARLLLPVGGPPDLGEQVAEWVLQDREEHSGEGARRGTRVHPECGQRLHGAVHELLVGVD